MAMQTVAPSSPLSRFLEAWGRDLALDLAQQLTCTEAEAIAELFEACGHTHEAAAWLENHSRADEEGDRHHQGASA
ncbi:hypothetical protein [Sinomonas sp. ASV322]|uniref:hypothetical protein n=1 Tax=Sinomonas sp. ASV322 TaxID=3041920 RepID=UPI0027DC6913|nr:hypothetical protein [Sinomonas sp. ASV322]MDQ4504412.1 hypothetical protein [Sinomonas sp. ASV322]